MVLGSDIWLYGEFWGLMVQHVIKASEPMTSLSCITLQQEALTGDSPEKKQDICDDKSMGAGELLLSHCFWQSCQLQV